MAPVSNWSTKDRLEAMKRQVWIERAHEARLSLGRSTATARWPLRSRIVRSGSPFSCVVPGAVDQHEARLDLLIGSVGFVLVSARFGVAV